MPARGAGCAGGVYGQAGAAAGAVAGGDGTGAVHGQPASSIWRWPGQRAADRPWPALTGHRRPATWARQAGPAGQVGHRVGEPAGGVGAAAAGRDQCGMKVEGSGQPRGCAHPLAGKGRPAVVERLLQVTAPRGDRAEDQVLSPDIAKVVRLARHARGWTQAELGAATGYSQSAISRIERGRAQVYDTRALRRIARALDMAPRLVGLADDPRETLTPSEPAVRRRQFLINAAALTASAVLAEQSQGGDETSAAMRTITSMHRRLDGTMPTREIAEPVLAHLRAATRRHAAVVDPVARQQMAAVVSEAAGFSGWLHWDLYDLGSARRYYEAAVKAARGSGDPMLIAYMLGSLAALVSNQGHGRESLRLTRAAEQELGPAPPATARAWLACQEAMAHAAAGDEPSTDRKSVV